MTDPRPVHTGQRLRADLAARGNGRLMVTFDFRTPGRTGFRPLSVSGQFARAGFDQVMIRSAANDWFVNAETPALEAALARLGAGYDRVLMLGFSMGGYGAFRFAAALGAAQVVAVSPQATIDPASVPWDRRFRAEARGFDAALGDLAGRGAPGCGGLILVDPFRPLDLRHARLIAEIFPTVRIVRLGFGGHPATGVLRAAKRAGVVQKAAMAEGPDPGSVARVHRKVRRQVAAYWTALARRAAARRPELAARALAQADRLRGERP